MKKFTFLFSLLLLLGIGNAAWAEDVKTLKMTEVTSLGDLSNGAKYVIQASNEAERYLATKAVANTTDVQGTWVAGDHETDFTFQWTLDNLSAAGTKGSTAYLKSTLDGSYVGTEVYDGRIKQSETGAQFAIAEVYVDGTFAGFSFKCTSTGEYLTRVEAVNWNAGYTATAPTGVGNALWKVYAVEENVVTPEPEPEPEPEPVVDPYPIAFDKDASYTHAERTVTGAKITSAAYGDQTVSTVASRFYNEVLAWGEGFEAASGEQVSVGALFNGAWMHNFFYLDRGNDGQFNLAELTSKDAFTSTEDDLLAFSVAGTDNSGLPGDLYYNMEGRELSTGAGEHGLVDIPQFNLPELADGFYRVRFKVDWGCVLPEGTTNSANNTRTDGGAIIDARLHIHGANINVTALAEGARLLNVVDGGALAETAPFGQALSFTVKGENATATPTVKVRYGYRFDGEAVQYGMEQWKEAELTADDRGVYTLTEEMTSADVRIEVTYDATEPPVELGELAFVSSTPANDAVMPTFPEAVALTFAETIGSLDAEMTGNFNSFEVDLNGTYFPSSGCTFTYEGSVLNVAFDSYQWMGDGSYRLTIPAGMVKNEDGTLANTEIVINFTVGTPPLSEEAQALVDEATQLLMKRGVGYPKADSEACTGLSTAVETLMTTPDEESMNALEAAIAAYKNATEGIQLPEAGKMYNFVYVTKAGTMAYLNYTGSDVALVAYNEGDELPESAAFTCEQNEDESYSFTTEDGKYLVYHTDYNGVNWLEGRGNIVGYEDTKTDMANITIAKMTAGGAVDATQSELFGFVTWYSKRGYDTSKNEVAYGYTVVKSDFTNYDGAAAPFFNANHTSAIRMLEYQITPTTVTVTPDPMMGELDALPSVVTMEFSRNVNSVESVNLRFDKADREGVELASENWTIEGNTVTLTIPEEYIQNKYEMTLTIDVVDEKNQHVTWGRGATGLITLNYYAKAPANSLVVESIDPAEGNVVSLKEFTLKMKDLRQPDVEAYIGGFDESKVVALNDANGEQVATATLALHPDALNWVGNYNLVVATLDTEVTTVGAYTLVIPEATIYDGLFYPDSEDFGVSWGAVYNQAATFTFNVIGTDAIESVETQNAVKSIYNLHGQKLNTNVKNLTPGVYIINGKKVVVK